MYRVGKHTHRHRREQKTVIGICVILVLAGVFYWLAHLRLPPKQSIQNAPPLNISYDVGKAPEILMSKPEFNVELPAGWTERIVEASPTAPKYTFSSRSDQAQQLDIYIDNPPTGMPLNRAVAVSAQGNRLIYDNVSENCATYTDPQNKNPQTGFAPARWQEIDFMCDMANAARAVVGTISRDGINQVQVTGDSGKTRKIFITYTDNTISPNYTTLHGILGSLRFK